MNQTNHHFCNNNVMLETILCLVWYAWLVISECSQLCFFRIYTCSPTMKQPVIMLLERNATITQMWQSWLATQESTTKFVCPPKMLLFRWKVKFRISQTIIPPKLPKYNLTLNWLWFPSPVKQCYLVPWFFQLNQFQIGKISVQPHTVIVMHTFLDLSFFYQYLREIVWNCCMYMYNKYMGYRNLTRYWPVPF